MPAQSQEVICGGRYLSGDDPMRVFAAIDSTNELTVEVHWRSGRQSLLTSVRPNRCYEIDESQAKPFTRSVSPEPLPQFADASDLLTHRHHEEAYYDYRLQPWLPFKLSQLGPGVTWLDIDRDGWEDLIVPTGRGGRMAAFRNNRHGGFEAIPDWPFNETASHEQTMVLGYADGTNTRLMAGWASYNEGLSNSSVGVIYDLNPQKSFTAMPAQLSSTGPLALADLEGLGRLSLFIGGRVIPGRFPEPATSLFMSQQDSDFKLDTRRSEAFARVGLVSAAIWTDLDGDGSPELVLACQPGLIRIFRFEGEKVTELTQSLGLGSYLGLWNSVSAGDFDGDGRMDLVAGNWGRNTQYQGRLKHGLHFYYGDLKESASFPVVEAYYDEELQKIVPLRDWETLATTMPFLRERYHSYTEFSTASVSEFLKEQLPLMHDVVVNTADSMVFLNRKDHFEPRPLPVDAQLAPVFGISIADFDGDGFEDLFLSQNFFGVRGSEARLDGGRGVLLKGNGRGEFSPVPGSQSGIKVYGEGRGVAICDYDHDGRPDLAIAQNANATKLYHNVGGRPGLRLQLQGPPGNPQAIGAVIRLQYKDRRLGPAREVHAGSGYWSQDAATQIIGVSGELESVTVRWPGGALTQSPIRPGVQEVHLGPPPVARNSRR
jgi:hypothetical protein